MKRRFSCLIILWMGITGLIHAQEAGDTLIPGQTNYMSGKPAADRRFSAELFFNPCYYVLHSPDWLYDDRFRYTESWSMGGGLLLSKYFHDIRLAAGIAYGRLEYRHRFETSADYQYDVVESLQIPVYISYGKGIFNPMLGVVISKAYNFNHVNSDLLRKEVNTLTWFQGSGPVIPPDKPLYHRYEWNATLMAGISLKFRLVRFFRLNVTPYYAFRTRPDVYISTDDPPAHNETLNQGRSLFGIQLGMEFVFLSGKGSGK